MLGIAMSSISFQDEMMRFHEEDSMINQYRPLAKKYQVDFCMFSFSQIRANSSMVEALVYSWKQDSLARSMVPVPRVNIYRNTGYVYKERHVSKFERLRGQNLLFINFPLLCQANKLQNHRSLHSLEEFKGHLPPTKRLSLEDLQSFVRLYGKAIIKPVYGSKGRGITIIEKGQKEFLVSQTSAGNPLHHNGPTSGKQRFSLPFSQLKEFYDDTFPRPSSFLVQQWIPFREYKGRPFDIRAVVQKNGKNRWQVTSHIARVAVERGQIANLSQGGEPMSLSKLMNRKGLGKARKFCLGIAQTFERMFPWTAEMGIDLAVGKDGQLWYIETNFCPEKKRWATIYKIPFEYACCMYSRG